MVKLAGVAGPLIPFFRIPGASHSLMIPAENDKRFASAVVPLLMREPTRMLRRFSILGTVALFTADFPGTGSIELLGSYAAKRRGCRPEDQQHSACLCSTAVCSMAPEAEIADIGL